jgi:glycerol-3-phosphate acyltransferase PlsY
VRRAFGFSPFALPEDKLIVPVMTHERMLLLALIPIAYVIGSIPFGLVVGLAKGVDPRKAGSGNIGATNVGRLLGGRYFALVFTLDLLKGLIPTALAGVVLRGASSPADFALWLLVGFAAIAGHMFSLFLKFTGGKGVATSAGVLLGVWPYFTLPGVVAIATFLILFKATRYVSVASMGGAGIFPVAYVIIGLARGQRVFGQQWPLLAFACLVAVLIIYKHRTNIARLRAGTENRFERKPPVVHDKAA